MNYNSKIDVYGWVSLFVTVGVLALPNFVFNFSWIYFIIMLVADVLILTFSLSTRYEFGDEDLIVKSGFLSSSISYDRIVEVNMVMKFFASSSTTAIKCIELKFGKNRYSYRKIYISPENENEFLTKLLLRCNESVVIENKRK